MKYQRGDFEAVHLHPIWREKADFVFAGHIGKRDGKNEWEQLWGKRISTYKFILCCIPFFVRNVSLGDEVETDPHFTLNHVVLRSGQITFRVWFGGRPAALRDQIVSEVTALKPATEWYSQNLLALSAPRAHAQCLADYLESQQLLGRLEYETGDD
jgi:hypothetical protein